MRESWSILIAAHTAGAVLAVVLGGYVLARPGRGDLRHRRVGKLWMITMYWVALSSFGIQRLHPGHFSWLHGLSIWTLVSLTAALGSAMTHRIDRHRNWVVGTYLGLLGAGIAAVAFPTRLLPATAERDPWGLFAALVAVAAFAGALIWASSVPPARRLPNQLSEIAPSRYR